MPAVEETVKYDGASAAYPVLYRNDPASGLVQVWNASTALWTTPIAANFGDYVIVDSADSGAGFWVATLPAAAITAGEPRTIEWREEGVGDPQDWAIIERYDAVYSSTHQRMVPPALAVQGTLTDFAGNAALAIQGIETDAGSAAADAAEAVAALATQGLTLDGVSNVVAQIQFEVAANGGLLTAVDGKIDLMQVDVSALGVSVAALPAPLDAAGTREALGMAAPNLDDQISGIDAGGTTQPRVNFEPAPGFTLIVPRVGPVVLPIRVPPGPLSETVFLDMSKLYGRSNFVETVGDPEISGGAILPTAAGPRDWYACVGLDGVATAGESRTVDLEVEMTGGQLRPVQFRIEVATE